MPNLDLYSDNNDISFHDSCLPKACTFFRHRRGRKTETSSDASQEMKSLATLPMAAGAAVAGRPPYRSDASARRPYQLVATSATLPHGKSVAEAIWGSPPSRIGGNSIPKIRPASGITW